MRKGFFSKTASPNKVLGVYVPRRLALANQERACSVSVLKQWHRQCELRRCPIFLVL